MLSRWTHDDSGGKKYPVFIVHAPEVKSWVVHSVGKCSAGFPA